MSVSFSLFEKVYHHSTKPNEKLPKHLSGRKLQLRSQFIVASHKGLFSRRSGILCSGASLVSIGYGCGLVSLPVRAEEKNLKEKEESENKGVLETIKSLFDPNEKTKAGKVLPKAYLKSVKEVVKTLRESLEEDAKDTAKFRRTADAAKESIREYLNDWRGQPAVVAEESYVALEKAIRSLAKFYSKAGPFAAMPEDVKSSILDDLNTAEASF